MSEAFANKIADLDFALGTQARVMWVSPYLTKLETLQEFGFQEAQSTLVIIGGANFMEPDIKAKLQPFFDQVLAPLAQELGITVLDGGTDAGVISMMGQARARLGGDFRLIGVVPRGKAKVPGEEPPDPQISTHSLEPHHTHFFLIPGNSWGTETPWLTDLATLLAEHQPSLTVLINGGETSLKDLKANLEADRLAVVVAGSGRLADRIAVAMADPQADVDPEIAALVASYHPQGKLISIDISTSLFEVFEQLKQYFVKAL
ncbi:MAG: hypothetical protein AAF609_21420 [Cyanobacteria bacterium P01_C01_bin.120]